MNSALNTKIHSECASPDSKEFSGHEFAAHNSPKFLYLAADERTPYVIPHVSPTSPSFQPVESGKTVVAPTSL
ncbi:DEKNAAC105636 [Brettanomyces naardenensis]|uniref:DEKNAAC105636 n=1 Tax=Brettanomyces naardenensis TaxID=13370 RepID=A0A448YTP7_BRENA|nr:DEKNAAC105636 [Brettanomyces naardenensis]